MKNQPLLERAVRERESLRESLFKSRRKKEWFEKVLMTGNFTGISEDTQEVFGIEEVWRIGPY